MARPFTFALRVVFLAFFALNAWNILKDTKSYQQSLHKSYATFEKTIYKLYKLKFPAFLASTATDKIGEHIVRGIAWGQLLFTGAALFISPIFTAVVGLIYFLISLIQLNAAKLSRNVKLEELEPFVLALGLFAASLVLSCSGGSSGIKKAGRAKFNESVAASQASKNTETKTKKKTQTQRD